MTEFSINCVCGSIFHGLTQWEPLPVPSQNTYRDWDRYLQRRNRTIDAIHQLNSTLAPPLDVRPVPDHVLLGYSRNERLKTIRSRAEKGNQTEIAEEIPSQVLDLTRERETFTSIAERVEQRKYVCALCGNEYVWRSSVYRHIKSDHQVNQETCRYCHVPYSGLGLLSEHLRLSKARGKCRINRGLYNTANKTIVAPPVSHGMPAMYRSLDMRACDGQ